MILADTSVWVEFLRGTGSPAHRRLRELIESRSVATTDWVMLEVLAGARDDLHRRRLRALLGQCDYLRAAAPDDFERGAAVSATCRAAGYTIRSLGDCLIAAVALRTATPLLHADRDFDAIADCTSLQVDPAG